MAQQTGRQYDDDLTVGADEYSESFSTDYVDLFEPLGDDDAPIAKLKSIILSIDWEITDEILHQLNDELQDLKDVWAGNKINLVYIQALEKLGRYIFAEKANSHPNAIKLLLSFYYDLEKIVSSVSMSEEEKKQLLLQDVKKFEQFKIQITPGSKDERRRVAPPVAAQEQVVSPAVEVPLATAQGQKNVLTNLKAIVLSIDWEISENELVRLNEEVNKLEKIFSESRAKLIFLQGIGALGNYIRSAKSNAHLDAFKLLHSFYEGLERVYNEVLSREQEKIILLAEVKKFNDFKAIIATFASEVVVPVDESSSRPVEKEDDEEGGVFAPAFADMPDNVHGFREDTEAVKGEIDKGVASFLGGEEVAADQFAGTVGVTEELAPEAPEVSSRLDALFGGNDEFESIADTTTDAALQGVDVETEADDDSDENALPLQGGRLAPALVDAGGQSPYVARESVTTLSLAETVAAPPVQGVDVETEADDESDEAALPRHQGGVAPALVFADEEKGFREPEFVGDSDEDEFDLEDRLHSFFGAEIEEASLGSGFGAGDDAREDLSATEASTDELGIAGVATSNEIRPAGSAEDVEEGLPTALSELFDLEGEEDAGEEEVLLPAFDSGVVQETLEMAEPEVPGLAGEEPLSFLESDLVVDQNAPVADIGEVASPVADFAGEEAVAGLSGEAAGESLDVIFEPVGDDVEVDELPVMTGRVVHDEVIAWELESLGRIRECITLMLSKKDETAYPALIVEINKLGQRCQTQFVKKMLVQLMGVVGQYLDVHRMRADVESLTLLQALCNKLEQVCRQNGGQEEMLFAESGKVLFWQQGLISALSARQREGDESSGVVNDLADLFSEDE